jgi:hypothetical protein
MVTDSIVEHSLDHGLSHRQGLEAVTGGIANGLHLSPPPFSPTRQSTSISRSNRARLQLDPGARLAHWKRSYELGLGATLVYLWVTLQA